MKKITVLFICMFFANSMLLAQKPLKELKNYLEQSGNKVPLNMKFAQKAISKPEAELAATMIYSHVLQNGREQQIKYLKNNAFTHGKYVMPFSCKIFGKKPADGRSLYISMHGGGNTAASQNDKQWQNQTKLYAPAEGVYFVPRAAVDDWNMWFQPHIDTLFDMIIQTAVTEWDVNPDKVYLMGYSAGGDGVYRLAPRLADRWAAASMMAGHPGDVSPVNLRNTGFMLWMGENDGAYNRNTEAVKFDKKLNELKKNDPEGYVHETRIVAGKGHWMERVDTVAVSWMSQFRRNPYPQKIAWIQDDTPHDSFYWLSVPTAEAEKGNCATVERSGNTFTVIKSDYTSLIIGLNDEMIDFGKPVKVIFNGKTVFDKKVRRTIEDIYKSVEKRKDKRLVFSSYISINTKQSKYSAEKPLE